jgi:glycosyltransferase involved in cell wall biosynthesis
MFHSNVMGRVVGRMAGVPRVIASEQTMGQEGRGRRELNRLTAPLADKVICVSQSVADFARDTIGIPSDQLVVIPNGVDTSFFVPAPSPPLFESDEALFGYVGRLHPVKGVNYLVAAFARVAAAHPHIRLQLVGEGSEYAALVKQAQELGVASQVEFLGRRSDIADLMRNMDILVLPSLWEGMPNVALEAMACGLPLIATAVGGTPEVVVDAKTGLLVPSQDVEALAAAMAKMLQNPEWVERMGRAGRERVECSFSIQNTVQMTVDLYDALLDTAYKDR